MNDAQKRYMEYEMHTVRGMVSTFSDTSSVRVTLFLPLADNFYPVHTIVKHVHMYLLKTQRLDGLGI